MPPHPSDRSAAVPAEDAFPDDFIIHPEGSAAHSFPIHMTRAQREAAILMSKLQPANYELRPPPRDDPCRISDEERRQLVRAKRQDETYKTSLCTNLHRTGVCAYADTCRFAHSKDELRLPPQWKHPKYKSVLCENFERHGECGYGFRCHYIHRRREARAPYPVPEVTPSLHEMLSSLDTASLGGTVPPLVQDRQLIEWIHELNKQRASIARSLAASQGSVASDARLSGSLPGGSDDANSIDDRFVVPGVTDPGSFAQSVAMNFAAANLVNTMQTYSILRKVAEEEREALEREQARTDTFKTELCGAFRLTGACAWGSQCTFAHSTEELRAPSQLRGRAHPSFRTALCKNMQRDGECRYGSRCTFVHLRPGERVIEPEPEVIQHPLAHLHQSSHQTTVLPPYTGYRTTSSPDIVPLPPSTDYTNPTSQTTVPESETTNSVESSQLSITSVIASILAILVVALISTLATKFL